jgi:hypothetical protein
VGCVRNARIRVATNIGLLIALSGRIALAQSAPAMPAAAAAPERSDGWNTATNVLAVSSLAIELLLPRVFYSDPEVTTGWKARWHVSALAPVMTLTALALLNEQSLKGAFAGARPGCDNGQGTPGCTSYGFLSTQAFVGGSALGYGAAVFLVDTLRWSDGAVNAGSLIGEIGLPLVLAPITTIGRTAGNWETGGQAWGSATIGLGVGLLMGLLYSTLQRPECGYTGHLICW